MTSGFEILPAIDLRAGRVVRLVQGDFERETAFSDDPVAVARSFADPGARGSMSWTSTGHGPGSRHMPRSSAGSSMRSATGSAVEVAGGLRTDALVAAALAAGAARAVVGTAALRDPAFAGRLVAAHGPDRIAVALDVRDGLALGEGWRPGAAGVRAEDALTALADQGVTTFEATAIDRDGLLGGTGPRPARPPRRARSRPGHRVGRRVLGRRTSARFASSAARARSWAARFTKGVDLASAMGADVFDRDQPATSPRGPRSAAAGPPCR